MHRVLCSTGALLGMPNGRNWRLLEQYREKLRCDGYEFMFYESWYPEWKEIMDYLRRIQLPIFAWHCEKRIGQHLAMGTEEDDQYAREKFLLNCRMAASQGVEKMVLHLWNGVASDGHIQRHIDAFSMFSEAAKVHGIDLLVENVVCNHQDPLTHFRMLAEAYPEIGFTFDTKMAAFHHQMTAITEEEWRWLWMKNHIRHLHINDYAGGYLDWQNLRTLAIGQGKIDFESFFTFLKGQHYQGDYTVEATSFRPDGSIDFDSLNESMAWLYCNRDE